MWLTGQSGHAFMQLLVLLLHSYSNAAAALANSLIKNQLLLII